VPYDPDTIDQYVPPSYTVTLTNTSSVPADVNEIVTIFNTAAETEMASDQESAGGVIAPGQSLSWSFPVPSDLLAAPIQDGTVTASIDDGTVMQNAGDPLEVVDVLAQSCQFEQWG
jgi:hypothetical protein